MNWEYLATYVKDGVDVLLVTFLIYQAYRLLNHTRAIPVVVGLFFLLGVSLFARFFELETLAWLFENLSNYLVIGAIVILHPELRRMFSRIGQTHWYKSFVPTQQIPVEEIHQATMQMAEDKIGALMVLVQKIGLKQLTEGGIPLEARLGREILVSIFYNGNPLHDGAVIIEGGQVSSAATYLPLSTSSQLKRTHGARHRSGLGISEESDALAIMVSEEKGRVSVAYLGRLRENIDSIQLKSILMAFNANRMSEEWESLFAAKKKKGGRA